MAEVICRIVFSVKTSRWCVCVCVYIFVCVCECVNVYVISQIEIIIICPWGNGIVINAGL